MKNLPDDHMACTHRGLDSAQKLQATNLMSVRVQGGSDVNAAAQAAANATATAIATAVANATASVTGTSEQSMFLHPGMHLPCFALVNH